MSNIGNCVKTLEKLSLLSCSKEVLPLLERALKNVEPILEVDTTGVEPLLWQNNLDASRLHKDQTRTNLNFQDIRRNAKNHFEDYVVVGPKPNK